MTKKTFFIFINDVNYSNQTVNKNQKFYKGDNNNVITYIEFLYKLKLNYFTAST